MEKTKLTKKTSVVLLGSLLAISLSVATSYSQQDKLVIEDSTGNKMFSVNDTGTVNNAGKLAVGTMSPATSQLSIVDESGDNARGIGAYEAISHPKAAVIDFRKMRGSYTDTPSTANSVLNGDYIGAFHAWGVDAAGTWRRGATINYYVDAPPTDGGVPVALLFSTGSNDDGNPNPKQPRMIIGSDGKITVTEFAVTHTGGSAYVCVDNNGVLYTSETGCP